MQKKHKKIILLAVIAHGLAAWFSVGYNHPDEHFQILEFCGYLMGRSPAEALPWEFAAQIRPTLQPVLAYGLHHVFEWLGGKDPFIFVFLLRLAAGFGILAIVLASYRLLLSDFKSEQNKLMFLATSLLLWFVPYFNVRFSSENMAALTFLLSSYWILKTPQFSSAKDFLLALVIGFFFGLSFEFRFQMGFALVGVALYLLFYKKIGITAALWMFLGFVSAVLVGTLSDWWFYGAQVCAPYNYFTSNIIDGKAATFGESPWWAYFNFFLIDAIPPLSVILLVLFGWGLRLKSTHYFSFAFFPFFIAHCMVAHKELRFLVPFLFPFCYFVAIGFQAFNAWVEWSKVWTWFKKLLLSLNIVMLCYVTFAPAHEAFPYMRFLYHYAEQQAKTLVYCTKMPLYKYCGLEVHFFDPKNVAYKVFPDMSSLQTAIASDQPEKALVLAPNLNLKEDFKGYSKEKVYCFFPDWINALNFNGWVDRSYIWSFYEVNRLK